MGAEDAQQGAMVQRMRDTFAASVAAADNTPAEGMMEHAKANTLAAMLFPAALADLASAGTVDVLNANTWCALLADARARGSQPDLAFLVGCLHANAVHAQMRALVYNTHFLPNSSKQDWNQFVVAELGQMQPPTDAAQLAAWRAVLARRVAWDTAGNAGRAVDILCESCARSAAERAALLQHLLDAPALLRCVADPAVIAELRVPRETLLAEAWRILSVERAPDWCAAAAAKCDALLRKAEFWAPACSVTCMHDLVALCGIKGCNVAPGILTRHLNGTAPSAYLDPCSHAFSADLVGGVCTMGYWFPSERKNVQCLKNILNFALRAVSEGKDVKAAAARLAAWKFDNLDLLAAALKVALDPVSASNAAHHDALPRLMAVYLQWLQPVLPMLLPAVMGVIEKEPEPGAFGRVAATLGDAALPIFQVMLCNWRLGVGNERDAKQILHTLVLTPTRHSAQLGALVTHEHLVAAFASSSSECRVAHASHLLGLLGKPSAAHIVAQGASKAWPQSVCARLLCCLPLQHVHAALRDAGGSCVDAGECGTSLRTLVMQADSGLDGAFRLLDNPENNLHLLTGLRRDVQVKVVAALCTDCAQHERVWQMLVPAAASLADFAKERGEHSKACAAALCTLLQEPWACVQTQAAFVKRMLRERVPVAVARDHEVWQAALAAADRDAAFVDLLHTLASARSV